MRLIAIIVSTYLLNAGVGSGQTDSGFSGVWKLNTNRSEIKSLPQAPDAFLKVDQSATALTVSASTQQDGPAVTLRYPLDGSSAKRELGATTMNTVTKWEGAALLVNTIVSGPQSYTVMERWKRSGDGNTLTIRRTIVRLGSETESTLVYE